MKIPLFISALIGFIVGIIIMLLLPNYLLFTKKAQFTLFSIANAPQKTIQAQIVSFTPDISWESRTATIPALLTNTIALSQGEEIDTGTGSAIISLDPIGTISVSKNSTIDFIQMLPSNIVLSQSKGTIVYDNNKNGPLGITVGNVLIQITAGKTSVIVDTKTNTITISTINGNATVAYNDTDFNSHIQNISAKQTFIFDNIAKTGVLKKI